MKYLLFDHGTDSFSQTDKDVTTDQEILQQVDDGDMDILTLEPSRGFCRALVGNVEDDEGESTGEFEVSDWERVEVIPA